MVAFCVCIGKAPLLPVGVLFDLVILVSLAAVPSTVVCNLGSRACVCWVSGVVVCGDLLRSIPVFVFVVCEGADRVCQDLLTFLLEFLFCEASVFPDGWECVSTCILALVRLVCQGSWASQMLVPARMVWMPPDGWECVCAIG